MAKKNDSSRNEISSTEVSIERFRHLSQELLKHSTQGLLREDFLQKVSGRIMEFSGSDSVELWVKEGPHKHFRCSVARSKEVPSSFTLVLYPLGEEPCHQADDGGRLSMERLCCDAIRGSVDKSRPYVTNKGSIWTCKQSEVLNSEGTERQVPGLDRASLSQAFKSAALIPIRLEEECVGLLQLKSENSDFFSIQDLAFYEDVSQTLAIALSHQYAEIELRERIKEITCLYGIARLVAQQDSPFDEIIQAIADLLPAAWLYPEIATARIILKGQSYTTEGFQETPHRQVSDIIVDGEKVGAVEVAYLEEKPTLDEGPFLEEERSLIDSVAREVTIFYESAKREEERALLQGQLRHADRLATIGQLAAGVAHELNEPLGNILGFAQLARRTDGLPGQAERDLQRIESASLHAREIIKKLMAFARQLPPKKTRMNLNDIVAEGLYFFEARCGKAGIDLIRRLGADLPEITVDPGQMNQVLVNLVVNAIQAMPKGGILTVETRAVEDGVCLTVEDTGIGMSEEIKKQIFLPFFTTKDINEGTGLGLAVVHGIVTSHRGRITIETQEGQGTRFLIHLPLENSQRAL